MKETPVLPYAALQHLLWDCGIVFVLWRDTAVALGGGRSFYSCIIPSVWPMEEEKPALFILGWTPRGLATASAMAFLGPRPDSSMLCRRTLSCCPHWGRNLHGGVVVVIIVHLEWGPSSTPNTRPFWAEPNKATSTEIKRRNWVRRGLDRRTDQC
jgi:hypothetical protein